MSRWRKALRYAAWCGVTLVGLALLAALNLGRLADFAMTPKRAFDAEAPPPLPDYALP